MCGVAPSSEHDRDVYVMVDAGEKAIKKAGIEARIRSF
jgi:hypothetical protein